MLPWFYCASSSYVLLWKNMPHITAPGHPTWRSPIGAQRSCCPRMDLQTLGKSSLLNVSAWLGTATSSTLCSLYNILQSGCKSSVQQRQSRQILPNPKASASACPLLQWGPSHYAHYLRCYWHCHNWFGLAQGHSRKREEHGWVGSWKCVPANDVPERLWFTLLGELVGAVRALSSLAIERLVTMEHGDAWSVSHNVASQWQLHFWILPGASLCECYLTESLQDYPHRPSLADCSLARGSVCAHASFGPHKVSSRFKRQRYRNPFFGCTECANNMI